MPAFPMFVDLKGKRVVVIGGGHLAWHKFSVLKPFEPDITVIAPDVCDRLKAENIKIIESAYEVEQLNDADMVICAVDDKELSKTISADCALRHIPVNVVDEKDKCSFIFGSMITDGELSIGISTNGASPTAAHYMKEEIAKVIPEHFDEILERLASTRRHILDTTDPAERGQLLKEQFYQLLNEQ